MSRISLNPFKGVKLTTRYTLPSTIADPRNIARYNRSNVEKPVEYVYSRNSRVLRGTASLMGVRLSDGSKGWVSREGQFISQDAYQRLMEGLDGTLASGRYDFSFEEVWNGMSAQQRADFVDATKDIDWDAFWNQRYREDAPLADEWVSSVDYVVEKLIEVLE